MKITLKVQSDLGVTLIEKKIDFDFTATMALQKKCQLKRAFEEVLKNICLSALIRFEKLFISKEE